MFYLPILPVIIIPVIIVFLTNVRLTQYKLLNVHSKPPHVDSALIDYVSISVPRMVFSACAMQLLYVRWAGRHMLAVQGELKEQGV